MQTNPPDPESVAAKLTKAQQEAVREADEGFLRHKHGLASITSGLIANGLLRARIRGQELDERLTPLGLAVRAALQSKETK